MNPTLDPIAERYVKLVLAVGEHAPDYVDAYYGPAAWRDEAAAAKRSLAEIEEAAARLEEDCTAAEAGEPEQARGRFLNAQIASLGARVRTLAGVALPFDAESTAIYGARARDCEETEFAPVLAELDALVPGSGPLGERMRRYREGFIVPAEKLDIVFRTTLAEARRRTHAQIALPAHEQATLELVRDKPWGGYNWFKGNAASLIQINTDLPNVVWRTVLLAAHEGYPGHHVHATMIEQHLVRGRGWIEFAVHPLESPMSLMAEGIADYGIELAFPDMAEFMQHTLFPLAGLDPALAVQFVRVQELAGRLSYAEIEAARRYLDGDFTRAEAAQWLQDVALESPEIAERTIAFAEEARAYIITYEVGREVVKRHVEEQAGADVVGRWQAFAALLASPPMVPELSPLAETAGG